jgi:GNAT superfamily N-acetyltransferase
MSFACRPARPDDAASCAPLVLASGEAEFGFLFGVTGDECIAFLARAFVSRCGRFSYRRHRVALDAQGRVCSVMAMHDGGEIALDDAVFVIQVLTHFGVRRGIGILLRGMRLAGELPPPSRGERLIAHCATLPDARGRGALTALMHGALCDANRREVVLDVRLDNPRARALYTRLGFHRLDAARSRHPRLPAQLASERMRFAP